jgi:hypothetical protein
MAVNTVSTQTIILAVQRTFKPKDNFWKNDAVQFIGEAIQAIRTHLPMEKKAKQVKVESRRARIPCDAQDIRLITCNGINIPVSLDSTIYDLEDAHPLNSGYAINKGYIICPFVTGSIVVHYVAIPKDDKGFPLIVDEFNYREAVKWWVMTSMLASGYEHPVFNYKDAFTQWNDYMTKAQNDCKMPSNVGELQNFANMWTRTYDDGDLAGRFSVGNEFQEGDYEQDYLPTFGTTNLLGNETD